MNQTKTTPQTVTLFVALYTLLAALSGLLGPSGVALTLACAGMSMLPALYIHSRVARNSYVLGTLLLQQAFLHNTKVVVPAYALTILMLAFAAAVVVSYLARNRNSANTLTF